MRLRVVVPGGRGGAGLRALSGLRLLVLPAVLLVACGSGDSERDSRGGPTPAPSPARAGLSIGLSEANANLLWSARARPQVADGFGEARDRVAALRPAYWRLPVDWAALQPRADVPPAWDRRADGCMRGRPPCAPYAGIRDELRAIASQQRDAGGFEVVVVIYGVPDWAAEARSGCERSGTQPRSRPIRSDALPAYRALARSLLRAAAAEDVALPWWSPWNEPNHPAFISPQRRRCHTDSKALSPALYTRLARALAAELRAAPGEQRLVVGELAGLSSPRRYGAGIEEFVSGLPEDVVCAGPVWAQHSYAGTGEGGPRAVDELQRVLRRRGGCAARARIWVTETGSGAPHAGQARAGGEAQLRASCRDMAEALAEWDRDPQVDAAFQYTFREDPAFPVGLMDAQLLTLYPGYEAWRQWAARSPGAPSPESPRACADR